MNVNRRNFIYRSVAIASLLGEATSTLALSADSKQLGQSSAGGRKDFDFFLGRWQVSAKRLRHHFIGDQTWEPVTGNTRVFQILKGAGNVDEDEFQLPGQVYIGGMLRLFDAKQNLWTTYGLDRDSGAVQPPQSGRFEAGRGEFYGDDEEAGRPIRVRHLYFNLTPTACRWEQAFSVDAGKSWETNWVIDFTRLSLSSQHG